MGVLNEEKTVLLLKRVAELPLTSKERRWKEAFPIKPVFITVHPREIYKAMLLHTCHKGIMTSILTCNHQAYTQVLFLSRALKLKFIFKYLPEHIKNIKLFILLKNGLSQFDIKKKAER